MQPQIVNRKARFDYEIIETFEAGIELVGTEVKSIRAGKVSLRDGFARIHKGELLLYGAEISPYENAGYAKHDPTRPRRLLLHSREIARLVGKISERGLTLIPVKVYFKRGWAKVQIALARGKRQYDKREAIRKKETQRDIRRAVAFRGKR
jgi:SsrA-binding protein